MPPTDFSKLQKLLQGLFVKGRTEEMLEIAFKLLELESGSGKILEFLLFQLPGDTVFAHKAADRAASLERASVFFRLAEICRDNRSFADMDRMLARYLRDGRDEFVRFLALCLACDFPKAYALAPALLQNAPSPEMLMAAADPWENIYPLRRIKPALAGVEAALPGLKGAAKKLAELHRFVLAQKAGLNPGFDLPRSISATSALLSLPAAKVFLDRLEFEKAEKILRAAAEAWPGSERTCGSLAEAMFCSGKQEAALELMAGKQALIRSPGFRAWRGQLLLFHGRYREAIAELGEPISSGNVLGWCWRGAALFKLGRCGPALRDLDTALRINPADWEARVWRAELLRTRKEPARALADLVRILKDLPEHPWALANLALLAAERGDMSSFAAAFRRLPKEIRLACGPAASGPAALAGLLERLKGVRRQEPRFFCAALKRSAPEAPAFPRGDQEEL